MSQHDNDEIELTDEERERWLTALRERGKWLVPRLEAIMNDMQEPLIYTANGNVPERSLRYEKQWNVSSELIQFCEFWYDSDDKLVKNNVHMYALKGLPAIGGEQYGGRL